MKVFFESSDVEHMVSKGRILMELLEPFFRKRFPKVGRNAREVRVMSRAETVACIAFLATSVKHKESFSPVPSMNEYSENARMFMKAQTAKTVRADLTNGHFIEGYPKYLRDKEYQPDADALEAKAAFYERGSAEASMKESLQLPVSFDFIEKNIERSQLPDTVDVSCVDPSTVIFSSMFHEKCMIPTNDETAVAFNEIQSVSTDIRFAHWFVHGCLKALKENPNRYGRSLVRGCLKSALKGYVHQMYMFHAFNVSDAPELISPDSPEFVHEISMIQSILRFLDA